MSSSSPASLHLSIMTTAPQPTSQPTSSTRASVNPTEVGWQFVPQYYTFVNKQPHRLHCFYTKNSTFSHGTEGEDTKPCYGQHEINQKILSLGYDNCKVFINSVDAMSSAGNGIIIQVIGEMSNRGEPWKKFVQTFFLAEQPNGYFVLNDIFKFLKEETMAEDEEEEAEAAEDASAQATQLDQVEETIIAPQPVVAQVDPVPVSYEPEVPAEQPAPEPVPVSPQVVEREPTPLPGEAPAEPAHVNGVNGHSSDVAESVEEEKPEETPAVEAEPEPVTTIPEPSPAPIPDTPAPVKVPSPVPAPQPAVQPAPAPAPAPQTLAAPTPPPKAPSPAPAPQGPKTWATLAATNNKKWGSVASDAKGVSAAAPTTPSAASPIPKAANGTRSHEHPNYTAASTVNIAQCFVKSVTENVIEQTMRDALTQRFGPIKELEIIRNRACAFLEFTTVEAARKAIVASLPPGQGGEGGIRLEGKPGINNLPPRIIVETRKERGERPAPRPRTGPPGEGRGIPGVQGTDGKPGGQVGRGRGSFRGRGAPPKLSNPHNVSESKVAENAVPMFAATVQPPALSLFSSSALPALHEAFYETRTDPDLPDDSIVSVLDDSATPEQSTTGTTTGPTLVVPDNRYLALAHRVLHIQSPTIQTTYLRCPPRGARLGITLPWLHLQVRNLEKEWSFEVGVVDVRGREGRIRCSTFQPIPILYPAHPTLIHLPFKFPEIGPATRTLWTTVDVYLPPLLSHLSSPAHLRPTDDDSGPPGTVTPFAAFSHVSYVQVYANCRLRRIWMSRDGDPDGPSGAWELKLYAASP
ncbi:hypothetical protein FRB99_004972 [Tulasnella sp. 403]|nr:hypothetical protein FRB99_004972 [Tulasnella sp. 403]